MLKEDSYLTADELVGFLREERNVYTSTKFVRAMWKAGCPHMGRYGRVDEFIRFWRENPDIQPLAKRNTRGSIRFI